MPAARVDPSEPAADGANSTSETQPRPPIVVDLGKRSRKKIKRLRRGKGPLMSETQGVLAELRQAETIDGDAQVVIVVVKQKNKRSQRFLRGLL